MCRLYLLCLVALALITPQSLFAGFDEGVVAYKNGDFQRALREFRQAAGHGDAHAQNILGFFYYHGTGVTRDYAEALRWYKEAADQGVAEAQFAITTM